eukprot:765598-Amphidinium_carterae.1
MDASASDVLVPLGRLGRVVKEFSLSTPRQSRNVTPRDMSEDPQLSWDVGALHASLARQAQYRQEMLEQEQSRAQDLFRFQEASAWVFRQGSSAVEHMDAIREESNRELLAERLRMSSAEVVVQ